MKCGNFKILVEGSECPGGHCGAKLRRHKTIIIDIVNHGVSRKTKSFSSEKGLFCL